MQASSAIWVAAAARKKEALAEKAAPKAEPRVDKEPYAEAEAPKPKPAINFHPSDLAQSAPVVTVAERNKAFEELADLYGTDPLAYVHQKREWAQRLCTTVKAIDDTVATHRPREAS